MINSKKVCARLSFDPDEEALYKDTLCFSVDTPDLELKGWRTMAVAPSLFVANFKRQRRLFIESFNVEILIDFEKTNKRAQAEILTGSALSVSSLMLSKHGTNKAENVVVPLKVANLVEDLALTVTTSTLGLLPEYTSTLLPYQRSFEIFKGSKKLVSKQAIDEVLIIDRIKDLWMLLRMNIIDWISSISFFKLYFILWVLLLLLLLRWFYPVFHFIVSLSGKWYNELFIFVGLVS